MKIYTSGLKVHKLGSPQDRIVRSYLVKESEKEVAKTQLLAMMVSNVIPFNNETASTEWQGRVKKIWNKYIGLEYGLEVPEFSDKETQMIDHYKNHVKHLKPVLTKTKAGGFVVTGLDSLKE